jgi:hypothetical protein
MCGATELLIPASCWAGFDLEKEMPGEDKNARDVREWAATAGQAVLYAARGRASHDSPR